MNFTGDDRNQAVKSLNQIEDTIARAIKKIGGRKENDLCKYLPMTSGGYMHHFTMRKMKSRQPTELVTLIEKFIISPTKPSVVKPKQRAARGSRKKRDQITFTKNQLERLLSIARQAGDKEMITVLSPKKSLLSFKRDLIQAVRNGVVDHDLWNGYIEAVQNQQAVLSFASEQHHNPFQN
ncbi:MAG: hypothetical protein EBU93_01570 [Chlamydiae bacterium]|jgi:hypothetical protein|nr:hypothetical protein [Chlamydiota bacterium]